MVVASLYTGPMCARTMCVRVVVSRGQSRGTMVNKNIMLCHCQYSRRQTLNTALLNEGEDGRMKRGHYMHQLEEDGFY